jgi:predicted O-methyltransferase YrrM
MRWFYEGHPKLRGQLWYAERKFLYETIRKHRPKLCFEIGTWRGGGSTLFISQALYDNGGGTLHTVEINKEFFGDAVANFRTHLPYLVPHIAFHLGDYKTIYAQILEQMKAVDFLVLDGAEDAEETLDQYDFFLPYMKPGSVLMVHDWFTEKTRLLKPMLENSDMWEIKRVLTPPTSVGLALAVRSKTS